MCSLKHFFSEDKVPISVSVNQYYKIHNFTCKYLIKKLLPKIKNITVIAEVLALTLINIHCHD